MDYSPLAEAALSAKENAYAPYSNFHVGAALLSEGGTVYTGCNIESAAFSPTVCAERTALFCAVSKGERKFRAIAIAGSPKDGEAQYCYPCGVCRQTLKEFVNDNFTVIIVKTAEDYRVHSFGELFPHSFGPENLGGS